MRREPTENTMELEDLLGGLRAAGETTRLRVLTLLGHGELTVKELTQILGQSQPRVSRHLKLLADAGLLERHREGAWVFFRRAEAGGMRALSRAIRDLTPAASPVIARDLERLKDVREARARAAQAYFRANAGEWDRIRSLHIDEALVEDALRAAMGDERIGHLFDLGTGTGRMLELFSDLCEHGVGVDLNNEMLSLARANLERAGCRHCQVRQGDIFSLHYDNAVADAVIVHQVLHYLEGPVAALQEAARILKPGGRMVITDFAPHELEFLREEHAHRRLGIAPDQMAAWCAEAGLEISDTRQLPPLGKDGQSLTVIVWVAHPAGAGKTARHVAGKKAGRQAEKV